MKKIIFSVTITAFFISIGSIFNTKAQASLAGDGSYKKGAEVEDANGVCVFVCPHSLAEKNCI